MKKNYLNAILVVIISVAFTQTSCKPKTTVLKYSREYFCGKQFTNLHSIDNIDMTVKRITILNCDGTFTSKEDWGTSKPNEETYKNTVGRASGNNDSFSGTWEVVDSNNLPSEVESYLRNYEGNVGKFYNDKIFTVIKYQSNKGKKGYLRVTNYNLGEQISLDHIITSQSGVGQGYEEADLNLYSGMTY